MARGEVTGKKCGPGGIPGYRQQTDNIPFQHRVFSSKQTQFILNVGKTKFFEEVLPKLKAYLDGNKLQITGQSILDYQEERVAEGRQPRPMPQLRKAKTQLEAEGGFGESPKPSSRTRRRSSADLLQEGAA